MPRSHGLAAASGHIRYSYNPNWSCPIPPKENRLKVAIRAGEKVFDDHSIGILTVPIWAGENVSQAEAPSAEDVVACGAR